MERCCRVLMRSADIEHFVKNILEIRGDKRIRTAITAIEQAENNIAVRKQKSTYSYEDFRDHQYRASEDREKLRLQVVRELISQQRPENDETLHLGRKGGGAAPRTPARQDHTAFYIVGSPASGKSGIANAIADAYGCYILDSDFAKRKLPEYAKDGGASLVHEESDKLTFSYENGNLLAHCLKNGYNIVIPKIGHNPQSVYDFCKSIRDSAGYRCFLISIDLDRFKSTARAYNRFVQTKRYVPLSLIFDSYSNEPTLGYFRLKQRNERDSLFEGFAQISTDVEKGKSAKLLEQINIDLVSKIGEKVNYDLQTE